MGMMGSGKKLIGNVIAFSLLGVVGLGFGFGYLFPEKAKEMGLAFLIPTTSDHRITETYECWFKQTSSDPFTGELTCRADVDLAMKDLEFETQHRKTSTKKKNNAGRERIPQDMKKLPEKVEIKAGQTHTWQIQMPHIPVAYSGYKKVLEIDGEVEYPDPATARGNFRLSMDVNVN